MSTVDSDQTATPLAESNGHRSYSSIPDLKESKSKKKKRTWLGDFQQQTFHSWRPIYTAQTVSLALFVFGIIFIPVGAYLLVLSERVQEIQIPYEDCSNTLQGEDFNRSCAEVINSTEIALIKSCKCRLAFNVSQEMKGTVYVYYALTNFFQNHRLYLPSRDNSQLKGDWGTVEKPNNPSRECRPYVREDLEEGSNQTEGRIYLPCGAIANSMFSDQINVLYKQPGQTIEVPLNRTGISWKTDQEHKFGNPEWFSETNFSDPEVRKKFAKPPAWRKSLWELDPENPDNNGMNNEDFIVWMRVAALPNFRKLFRILNRYSPERPEFADGMPLGEYTLEIDYAFPVTGFGGTKSIIFTTQSSLGLPNRFLGATVPHRLMMVERLYRLVKLIERRNICG
ncbi:unnamed protein product [Allacma fusca]|uniref:Cell cycle control protein 50A n=1 Tax=Allacma fusca TaxID=39272 RepID=A0A8J2JRJ4_9HEXA|nr:unnamed protein product [Allacma fusca]